MPLENVPYVFSENDERFRIMADVAPVMIWMAGLDKLCYFFNQPWLEYTGRTMEQEMGNGWAEGVHPDDLSRCLDIYVRSFEAHIDFRMEYRLQRHDGVYRWILDTGRPVFGKDGSFNGFIGSCIDITDLKEAEERNLKLQVQVFRAQKMEAIGGLAAGIAHDMKNLLLIIQGNAELICKQTDSGTKLNDYATRISASSTRASDMVHKLLLFSSKHALARDWIDYGAVVQGMLDLLERLIPPDVEVEFDRPGDLWAVNADAGLLEQVLVNLVTNARDAVSGRGKISISLSNVVITEKDRAKDENAVPGSFVLLTVADNGKGMAPEVMARIFDPFFTTKAPGVGTGLGLSTVYGVVKLHDGWISVDSEPNVGSQFRIYLPADPKVKLAGPP
ncbi:MAG: ATP-binding protein [Methanomassiliicoccales archaeon]